MSDAPPMTEEDAAEDQYIKDHFMNDEIFKAKKAAIKEQKSSRRQTRDPGQYQVSEAAKACIEGFVTHVRNQVKAPAASTIQAYKRVILSYLGWYENAPNASGKRNVDVLLQSHRVITLGGCRVIFWAV